MAVANWANKCVLTLSLLTLGVLLALTYYGVFTKGTVFYNALPGLPLLAFIAWVSLAVAVNGVAERRIRKLSEKIGVEFRYPA